MSFRVLLALVDPGLGWGLEDFGHPGGSAEAGGVGGSGSGQSRGSPVASIARTSACASARLFMGREKGSGQAFVSGIMAAGGYGVDMGWIWGG